jgi:formylglycine-generating enzyme required for sulfatase activity
MNVNPSHFKTQGDEGEDLPVESVTWDEADAFCTQLSANPAEKQRGRFYRLPTEAEWTSAYRAGSATPHYFALQQVNEYAWTRANAERKTHPVGKLKPNAWGFYDMNGNCWEWCADAEGETDRVVCGGSIFQDGGMIRTVAPRTRRTFDFGFRVACTFR